MFMTHFVFFKHRNSLQTRILVIGSRIYFCLSSNLNLEIFKLLKKLSKCAVKMKSYFLSHTKKAISYEGK